MYFVPNPSAIERFRISQHSRYSTRVLVCFPLLPFTFVYLKMKFKQFHQIRPEWRQYTYIGIRIRVFKSSFLSPVHHNIEMVNHLIHTFQLKTDMSYRSITKKILPKLKHIDATYASIRYIPHICDKLEYLHCCDICVFFISAKLVSLAKPLVSIAQ